jgi:hypothetical protein
MRSPTRRLHLRCLATQRPEDRCCSCERRADTDGRACHGSPLRFHPRLNQLLFRMRLPHIARSVAQCYLHDFGKMQRVPRRFLLNLL